MSGKDFSSLPGNSENYSPDRLRPDPADPLKGRKLIFLGSSVTYGSASGGVSFADYVRALCGCEVIKEAVPGTTLTRDGADSYIERLGRIEAGSCDIFVCQLSTNDASKGCALGEKTGGTDPASFDLDTVAGAIEHVIRFARRRWGCRVVFYTNPPYESEAYADMVALLREISIDRGVKVIDLWNESGFEELTDDEKALYMADRIHPTKAGYLEWWAPVFIKALREVIED